MRRKRRPGSTLNPLLALGAGGAAGAAAAGVGPAGRAAARERAKLEPLAGRLLHRAADCTLHLPAAIGDYTDFFAGIHHATTAGRINRPDNPLMPNYKYLPVAYHSRASSVRASGVDVRRPNGQRKLPEEAAPSFGPCRNLDYELELGVWIGPGNALGEPIPIGEAAEHIAGFCLLNDWSARDIQVLGDAAAWPVPGEEPPDQHLSLDHHGRGAGAVPHRAAAAPGGRSSAAAASVRRGGPGAAAGWTSASRCCC